jgi:NADPH:quinone reductase-like Zn-dependent oxidoreductase
VTRFRPGDEVFGEIDGRGFAEYACVPEGADQVIDYTRENFTTQGERYDLILQLAGTRSPSDCRRALSPKGTLLLSSGESSGRWIGPVDRIIMAQALSRS